MRIRRSRVAGFAAAAVIYLIVCVAMIGTGGHVLRPLYEGIGPAAPYRWVHPPVQFKTTNSVPDPTSESVSLTASGSPQFGGGSGDAQLVLTFPADAIPPSGARTTALISVTPTDPAKLGPLPADLYSDGNAYQVTASYQPSGKRLITAARPIDAVIETPVPSAALLSSPDGKTWVRITDRHITGQAAVAATFTSFGYLLAAANVPVVVKPVSGGSRVLLVVILGLVAVVPVGAAVLWRNGRWRRSR